MSSSEKAQRLHSLLLLTPVVSFLVAVLIVPSIWALVLSFHEYSLTGPRIFIGIDNFLEIFTDASGFIATTARTFLFVLLAVGGEFLLALGFFAVACSRISGTAILGRPIYRTVCTQ